jgi:hypothetical protein
MILVHVMKIEINRSWDLIDSNKQFDSFSMKITGTIVIDKNFKG